MTSDTSPKCTIAEWLTIRDMLIPSIEKANGTHTEEDVFFMCAAGQLKLWRFEKSCAVTQFEIYPRKKVLSLFLVAGDLDELISKEPQMVQYAKENGCNRISGAGRKGWERTHPNGWEYNCTALYKDI